MVKLKIPEGVTHIYDELGNAVRIAEGVIEVAAHRVEEMLKKGFSLAEEAIEDLAGYVGLTEEPEAKEEAPVALESAPVVDNEEAD